MGPLAGSKGRILIIEDDIDMVASMKIALEANGYQVIVAYEPEDGQLLAVREHPDLVVLDIIFGSRGQAFGLDYARQLRQKQGLDSTPILMVSALNLPYRREDFSTGPGRRSLGGDGFIKKPAQPKELIKRIEELLCEKRHKAGN